MILAGPLALWLAVITYPGRVETKIRSTSRRMARRKGPQPWSVSYRLWLVGAMWMTAAVILWPKITHKPLGDPEIAAAMNRATKVFQHGKYEEALARFRLMEIPECFPRRIAQKYHNMGLIQLKLGSRADAEMALKKAISYDSRDFDAYYLLACIAYEANDYSKGLQCLRDAQSQAQEDGDLPESFTLLKTKLERLTSIP